VSVSSAACRSAMILVGDPFVIPARQSHGSVEQHQLVALLSLSRPDSPTLSGQARARDR
jgi:hypothetical protein